MSHYTVLIIGEDAEKQLAPYDENNTETKKPRWDWYELGGRWTGFFKLKPGKTGRVGEPGIMTKPAKRGYADSARKGDIDIEGMRNDAEQEARDSYLRVARLFGGKIPKIKHLWKDLLEDPEFKDMSIDKKRDFYHAQTPIKTKRKLSETLDNEEDKSFLTWLDLENYQCTIDEYAIRARNNAVSTFAVIKNGKWYEKGKMGWWGIVSNEKDNWELQFSKLFDSIPDTTIISVYDCHI